MIKELDREQIAKELLIKYGGKKYAY